MRFNFFVQKGNGILGPDIDTVLDHAFEDFVCSC